MKLKIAQRYLAASALVAIAATVVLGLFITPPDAVQGNLARLVYVHPAVAWVAYLAYGVTTLASSLYLWRPTRSLRWDRLASSSAEVGVVFTALTLITGSIWGRPAWGVWWTWDARLTTTAILLVLYLGYLALRAVPMPADKRAKRSAIAALFAFIDVPIVHESVVWWRTLHQGATVASLGMNAKIHGIMAWTMLLGFVAFTLAYCALVVFRYRIAQGEDSLRERQISQWQSERLAQSQSDADRVSELLDNANSKSNVKMV
ncbi:MULTISPECIES: cytochrome c biogenesis protein CcsA [Acidithrix]|uniref:Heme exporter protein C n=1 Tax=Acidithrix ferrooxidans TaxID=1280514 RepID=A0A0D8HCQ9_9ACTN|nr:MULTISPECIES: cytochrome c biogenesis protein CcsA [Acidithrix]KJF15674.1 heme exporter protein C [Acidithrix ferrooxidans]CAG4929816.1 unnamed protein product [Acidithrix sp. C25]